MNTDNAEFSSTLQDAVYRCAGRAETRNAVAEIYAALQQAIDTRRPICNSSGRCCHFEEFGHRLYVTTLELAAFVYELETRSWPESLEASRKTWNGIGCPFQTTGLCGLHPIRPFGCRIYFCDPTSTAWQQDQYEQFHANLKKRHEELEVPYFYVEWRQALDALGLATPPALSKVVSSPPTQ